MRLSPIDSFNRFFVPGPENLCWLWHGGVGGSGYGRFGASGRRYIASRFALEQKLGRPLGSAEKACHTCDNPLCVNPSHLFLGSAADNRADCIAKGRAIFSDRRRERNPRAKLTESQVCDIRLQKGRQLQRDLAASYGVSRQTISAIQNGDRWS